MTDNIKLAEDTLEYIVSKGEQVEKLGDAHKRDAYLLSLPHFYSEALARATIALAEQQQVANTLQYLEFSGEKLSKSREADIRSKLKL
jgi:hypothetical protein